MKGKKEKSNKMPENRSLKTIEAHKLYFQFRKASLNRTGVYAHNYMLSIRRMDFSMCLSVVRVWIVGLLQNKCAQVHLENIPELRKFSGNKAQKEDFFVCVHFF